MLRFIDNFLNRITMYRLVLYFLFVLVGAALGFSWFGKLFFKPQDLLISLAILMVTCVVTNKILGKIFRVETNADSDYITALILSLISTPGSGVLILVLTGIFSQLTKYILAWR